MQFCFIKDRILLIMPITPSNYKWSHGKNMETINISQIGDVYLPGGQTKFEGSFDFMLPAQNYPFLEAGAYADPRYYLHRNDGTYKFTGASPEQITRLVCSDRQIPVSALPSSGIPLRRKFAGVKLDQIVTTVWTLAGEKNGKSYAVRYTPSGLLVKERTVGTSNLVLKAASNLMNAMTKEDATQMVNSVAIYDSNGNFLRRTGDGNAQRLYGVMEQHITQNNDSAADTDASAKKIIEDGRLQQVVTVNILGDTSLLTGETVVVNESKTALKGIFWIDADVHTWKNNNYYTKLTLNCRNVMATATAGGDLD